jgi:hypothetical protein
MIQKKSLYFEAGAQEVWFCRQDGTMEFYDRDQPETRLDGSMKGLGFPGRI